MVETEKKVNFPFPVGFERWMSNSSHPPPDRNPSPLAGVGPLCQRGPGRDTGWVDRPLNAVQRIAQLTFINHASVLREILRDYCAIQTPILRDNGYPATQWVF